MTTLMAQLATQVLVAIILPKRVWPALMNTVTVVMKLWVWGTAHLYCALIMGMVMVPRVPANALLKDQNVEIIFQMIAVMV